MSSCNEMNSRLDLLVTNVNYLSNFKIDDYSRLYNENSELKTELESLKESNKNLRKRTYEQLDTIRELEMIIHPEENCENSNVSSKYKIKKYRKTKSSYDQDKINETLRSIHSIEDIIKIKHLWKEIKHNETLQCLYNIVPAVEKLNDMVGLDDVKDSIFKKIIYYIRNRDNEDYLHTVISGPPGVGKTEVAKIYADIFVRLGILKTDKFVEVKRDDLVGKYLGQTAPKTRKLLDDAMGGVVFIDEAYSLGNSEKRDSFSKEAIDMINQYLSEKKNEFMLIVAGYESDLEDCFFAYNSGLKRRFSSYFRIKDYDHKQLKEIFVRKIDKTKYDNKIDDNELDKFFEKNHKDFEFFGGDVEKVLSEVKFSQSLRTFRNNDDSSDVIIKDLEEAYANFMQNKKKKEKSEPPFGMYF